MKHGVPVAVTYRAARRPPEPLAMVLLEVRSDLDPPRRCGVSAARDEAGDSFGPTASCASSPPLSNLAAPESPRCVVPLPPPRCPAAPLVAACGPSLGTQGPVRSPAGGPVVRPGEGQLPRGRLRRRPGLGAPRPRRRAARRRDPRAVGAHRARAARLRRGAPPHRGPRLDRRARHPGPRVLVLGRPRARRRRARGDADGPEGQGRVGARRRGARAARRRAATRSRWRAALWRASTCPGSSTASSLGAANVVPCELDGERILALVATGPSEVLIDTNSRHEPRGSTSASTASRSRTCRRSCRTCRPSPGSSACPSRRSSARSCCATRTRRSTAAAISSSCAVRTRRPPPDASRVPLYYLRGGGMMLRATVTAKRGRPDPPAGRQLAPVPAAPAGRRVEEGRHRRRIARPLPDDPDIKRGMVPMFRMGGFDLAKMPGHRGRWTFTSCTSGIDIDLGGRRGGRPAGLLPRHVRRRRSLHVDRAGPDAARPRAAAGWSAPDGPPLPLRPRRPHLRRTSHEQPRHRPARRLRGELRPADDRAHGPHRARVGALQRRHRGHRPAPDAEPALLGRGAHRSR